MKLRALPLLFLLLVSAATVNAQKRGKARLDSLLKIYQTLKEDTTAVIMLRNISFEYMKLDPAKGIVFAGKMMALSQKIGWQKGIGQAYNSYGNSYLAKADYPAALDNYFKALKINEDLGDKNEQLKVISDLSIVYRHEQDYDKALTYQLKVLSMTDKKDYEGQEYILGSIATTYASLNKPALALEYNNKALAIARQIGDEEMVAKTLTNIGYTYLAVPNYYAVLVNANKALPMTYKLDEKRLRSINLLNLGEAYLNIGKNIQKYKPDSLIPAGKAANIAKAITFSQQAIEACKQTGNKIDLQSSYGTLSDAYAFAGNYKGAYANYKLSEALKDSIFSEGDKVKIANLSTQRELDIKNKQLQIELLLVEKKRSERDFFIVGIILLFGITILVYRSYEVQKRTNGQLQIAKEKVEERTHELDRINHQLEDIIAERTKDLQVKNKKLTEYSLYLSHQMRGPIATLKGILNLENEKIIAAEECVELMSKRVGEIDDSIIDMNNLMDDNELLF